MSEKFLMLEARPVSQTLASPLRPERHQRFIARCYTRRHGKAAKF
jgi:hypothetical protein